MMRAIVWGVLLAVIQLTPGGLATATGPSQNPSSETDISGSNLFEFEKHQLTIQTLANLKLPDVSAFTFRDAFSPTNSRRQSNKCKVYPEDAEWPSKVLWEQFNATLGGALIMSVPEASICYSNGTVSNSSQCQALTDTWSNSSLRIEDPTSIRSILFQGMTCMPPRYTGFFLSNRTILGCRLGGFPEYVVKVTNVSQVQLAVNFARNRNLRLVIKNTGHDFGAKSVGKGALSIWTHYLKDHILYENYETGDYRGMAIKLGAGIQVEDANRLAKQYGITIVGGEGKTVGHIGGYIQGGGHSPLTSTMGMAADHVLSMEIVTADGNFITANTSTNSDIFWAIRGGGGSTFGVVTSMIVKAYPKMRVTTMRYNMTTGGNFTQDKFWAAHKVYVDDFAKYADLGYYCYYRVRHVGSEIFHDATSWIAPNTSESDFRASVAPMFSKWAAIGVPFTPIIQEYDNYPDAWADAFPQEAWTWAMRQASRLFPREILVDEKKKSETLGAIRSVFDEGANLIMFNIRNPPGSETIDNAVNPAWRKVLMFAIMFTTWNTTDSTEYVTQLSRNLTYAWNPRWIELSPGAGTYMSESDYIEPNWQQSFFGNKYERLLQIKKKWDPDSVFYATNAVGSEDWVLSETLLGHLPSQNSKLCRK